MPTYFLIIIGNLLPDIDMNIFRHKQQQEVKNERKCADVLSINNSIFSQFLSRPRHMHQNQSVNTFTQWSSKSQENNNNESHKKASGLKGTGIGDYLK